MSIRAKIIFGMMLISTGALGGLAFYSLTVFKKDKLAYILDSGSELLNSKAAAVRRDLLYHLDFLRTLAEFDWGPSEEEHRNRSLRTLPSFQMVSFEQYKKGERRQLYNYNVTELDRERLKQVESECPPITDANPLCVRIFDAKIDYVFLRMRSEIADKGDFSIERVVIFSPEIVATLGGRPETKITLLQLSDVEKWMNTRQVRETSLKESIRSGNQFGSSVVTVLDQPAMASFSAVGVNDLYLISVQPLSSALAVITSMINRYIIFLVAILSLIVILAVVITQRLTEGIYSLMEGTRQIARGNFKFQLKIREKDEIGQLAANFNSMAKEVDRLILATAAQARMESELETAQTIQDTLFPAPHFLDAGLEVFGDYETASECGGDFWYYFKKGDDLYFFIGDAVGHGVPAALMTASVRAGVSVIEAEPPSSLADGMKLLNRLILESSRGSMCMSFFILKLNSKTGECEYVNASHVPALIVDKKLDSEKRSKMLSIGEPVGHTLGTRADATYESGFCRLEFGQSLFLYTDGFPEAVNEGEKPWDGGFIRALSAAVNGQDGGVAIVNQMKSALTTFRGTQPLLDDAMICIIRRTNSN